MKKRILSFVLTLCMLVSMLTIVPMTANATDPTVWDGSVASAYASGSGTSEAPYIINNGAQLAYFSQQINSSVNSMGMYVELGADITLNTGDASDWATTAPANVFNPIGLYKHEAEGGTATDATVRTYAYKGSFDGKGHTISGLYVNVSGTYQNQGSGLFGIIGTTAVIKNFAVVNSYVKSNRAVGVIGLALADGFLVDSIYSEIIAEGIANVGGVVGQLSGTTGNSAKISNCLFAGSVKATKDGTASASGGILGNGNSKFIQVINCLNVGSVTAEGNFIAGIVGRNDTTTTITNCINIGDIVQTGTSLYTAGIWTGALGTGKTITMTNCHSTGNTLYINSSTTGTITPTNVGYFTEKFLGAGAQAFTGWTARTGDVMVPTAVAGYVTSDILYDFSTSGGAAVRFNTPTGLRFTGVVGKAYLDSLKTTYGSANVSYGMIIAPTAYVTTAGEFTIAALDTAEQTYKIVPAWSIANSATASTDGYYKFNAVLSNVKEDNYANEFSAITYIKIVDGVNTIYIYAGTSTSRSIDVVSKAALADLSNIQKTGYQNAVVIGEVTKYSPYTEAQRGILAGFTVTLESLNIISYNIRGIISSDNILPKPTYEISGRGNDVVTTLLDSGADVMGLQEVNRINRNGETCDWRSDYLCKSGTGLTSNGYTEVLGLSRGGDSYGAHYNPIYYKTEKYNLLASSTIWLNPDGTQGKISGSYVNRIMTYAILQSKVNGMVFMFVNTHIDIEDMATVRAIQARYLMQHIKEICVGQYSDIPVIVSGDFNSTYSYTDQYSNYPALEMTGDAEFPMTGVRDAATFKVYENGYTGTQASNFTYDGWSGPIDMGFVTDSENVQVIRYEVVDNRTATVTISGESDKYDTDVQGGKYPSDHLPIQFNILLTNRY